MTTVADVGKTFVTRDITAEIGTEVIADKAALLSGDQAGTIRELMESRGVLVFPKIGFTDDEQIAFTETLYKVSLDTEVNTQADHLNGSLYWHLDATMHRATPYDPTSGRLLQRTKLAGQEPFA